MSLDSLIVRSASTSGGIVRCITASAEAQTILQLPSMSLASTHRRWYSYSFETLSTLARVMSFAG